jgi:hypothetical protein
MLVWDLDSLWLLGNLWLFNIKSFSETCIFSIVDQPKGLVVCDNGSAHCKIAKDVSQLKATAIPLKVCENISD